MKEKGWDTIFYAILNAAPYFYSSSIPPESMDEIPPRIIGFFVKSSDFTMLLLENARFLSQLIKATFPNPLKTWPHSELQPVGPSSPFPQKVEKVSPLFSTRFGNPSRLDPVGQILHIINHS
jgi:hypothetical protein